MAFLDRFKGEKNSEGQKAPKAKKTTAKAVKSDAVVVKTEETTTPKVVKSAPAKNSNAYRVLVRPLTSEKTARLEKNRQFVFVVTTNANKVEIKKAVEKHYNVHVTNVNVVNIFGKKVRTGRVEGKRNDWRKAYVTVAPGESITF